MAQKHCVEISESVLSRAAARDLDWVQKQRNSNSRQNAKSPGMCLWDWINARACVQRQFRGYRQHHSTDLTSWEGMH